jgi:exonuclease SbcC
MSTLKLKVQKYRRFADPQEITFHQGLTIISGSNGTGKSTLVEAILFALFGTGRGSSISDIRSDKRKGDPSVECELFIDDQLIHIVRTGNSVEVSINGIVQVMGGISNAKAANKQISTLLGGLTRDQFESSYVALQGDTAGLVEHTEKERRILIERILQLEVLSRAVDLQVKRSGRAKSDLVALGNVICDELSFNQDIRKFLDNFQTARVPHTRMQYAQGFLASIVQSICDKQKNLAGIDEQVSVVRTQEAERKSQLGAHLVLIQQAREGYQKHENRQKTYNEIQVNIVSVDGKITQIKLDIQKFQADIQKAAQYAEASAEYEQLQKEEEHDSKRLAYIPLIMNCYEGFTKAQVQLEGLNKQLENYATVDEELDQALNQERKAKEYLDSLRNHNPILVDYEEWQKQDTKLRHEEEQNKDALKQLKESVTEARCPTCNQRFIEHTPEHRIQHLTLWLSKTLPTLRDQLQQQKQHIDEIKEQWEQTTKKAEQKYSESQKCTVAIEKRITVRDTLCHQQVDRQSDFLTKQQAWVDLDEKEPDPEEKTRLLKKQAERRERLLLLKVQADEYAQIPFIQKRLTEKEQAQEDFHLQNLALLEMQGALGYNSEAFQAAKDQLEGFRKEEIALHDQLHQAQLALQNLETAFLQAQKRVKKIQEYHDRFDTYVREYYREERLSEHLDDFKKHFFEANTGEVIRRTTQLLSHAITDQSILGVRFEKDKFQYLDASNIPYSVNRLSGGEKALVGLCLRIALAEQAQAVTRTGRVKFLILDEVLSSLDDERCDAVQRIFADVQKRGIFEHVIMITHLDSVKQGWQANGLVVQKVDGKISTVLSVSPGEASLDLTEE